MAENERPGAAGSQVTDHRKSPRGVLPKNAQTWLILGISLVVILVIAFSGNPPRKPAGASREAVPSANPLAPSPQTPEEELARRLAEQQRLQEESMRVRAQSSIPSFPGLPQVEPLPALDRPAAGASDLEEEMRRREYTSLFASNVALTYREDVRYGPRAGSSEKPAAQPLSQESPFPPLQQLLQGYSAPTGSPPAQPAVEPAPQPRAPNPATPAPSASSSKQYVLFEGSVVETALINRLASDFSGPVITMVTNPVYSHDRAEILIPAGTKCVGEAKRVETLGQTRLAVVFHRLIMPDGYSVDLDQFQGLNQIGETGLKDKVNHHYVQIFGASIAIGALGALSNRTLNVPYGASAATTFSESAVRVLDRFLNILPTVTIREGHRVKVFLAQDLALPAYKDHSMPKDL